MNPAEYEIGLIGLGEMGRNLTLNIADHGFSVAVYNRTLAKTQAFMEKEAEDRPVGAGYDLPEFIRKLRRPRTVLLLVPAGRAVDELLQELLPWLTPGDLIIDGGNSFFRDTDQREKYLAARGLLFMGLGLSGGGAGARFGPSLMPGGPPQAYEQVRPVLEAIAAKVEDLPCVAYLGGGSAGHYVKMVHNGIEYGLMQLIAETYQLLKQGLGLDNDDLYLLFSDWNKGELKSYLIEITSRIFLQEDDRRAGRLIDRILDQAGQKGTGLWTSASALELQVPVPTIDLAESMRDLSARVLERQALSRLFERAALPFQGSREEFQARLQKAFYGAMVLTYAQGLALLQKASRTYQYGVNPEEVARIWRGGCIIRAALLEKVQAAFRKDPNLLHLLLDREMAEILRSSQEDLRSVIKTAVGLGIPAPGFMTGLIYFDSFRSHWLPANLIQAQRDYFGAHTYQRVDAPGVFHTQWKAE
jgi:6-phosphogluconate dehydrogenase